MNPLPLKNTQLRPKRAFTLVEMLVVIVIMSILMTAGAIGLNGLGGKGVTSGVATAESLFDEARAIAVGQRINSRVLIAKSLTNNPGDNLRRIIVIAEELNSNGTRRLNADGTPSLDKWIVSSRGAVLPDQTYFSQEYSKAASGPISEMPTLPGAKPSFAGSYFYYEFNSEGICTTPGAKFVIGSGSRSVRNLTEKPRVTSAGKRDFGGFVVWRNGRTSVFRSPTQISSSIQSLTTGAQF